MSDDGPDDLASRLEASIRAVPGVSDVYSAAPVLARAAAELPLAGAVRPALVHLVAGAPPAVTTSIGVDPAYDAPAVAARVAATLRETLDADAIVTVRVGRVSA